MKCIQKFLNESIKTSLSKKSLTYKKSCIGLVKDNSQLKKYKVPDQHWKKQCGEEHELIKLKDGSNVPKQIFNKGKNAIQGFFDKQKRKSHFKVPEN